jgi:hypothetical protein
MAFCFLAMLYNSCSLKQRSLLGKGLFGWENTSHPYWIILNLQLVCHAPYFFRLFREQFTYGESEINTLNFLFTWECICLRMQLLENVFILGTFRYKINNALFACYVLQDTRIKGHHYQIETQPISQHTYYIKVSPSNYV